MRSFTSIFKRTRTRELIWAWSMFGLVFLLMVPVGLWYAARDQKDVRQEPLQRGFRHWSDLYLFQAEGGLNFCDAIYYGIGPSVERMRDADILILGNSRPMFAFREDRMETVQERSGLRFFLMAGPGDNVSFSEDVLSRQHLRPKVLIINDDNFFNPELWPFQKETMAGSWWHSWSKTYSDYGRWLIRHWIHAVVPDLLLFKPESGKDLYTLCSPEDGFLFKENCSGGHVPIKVEKVEWKIDPFYLEQAKDFVAKMKAMDIQVVLTFVPYGRNPAFIKKEAAILGVPYVLPKVEGLETFDGKHLTPESAARFSDAFFVDFFKLPEIEKIKRDNKVLDRSKE